MTSFKNWLLPILTGLIVLACALLPRQLSQLQDKKIFHLIHAESMSADSSLPISSPDLLQKIHLLASWDANEPLMIIICRDVNEEESTPEELRTMRELILSELNFFIQENLFPQTISVEDSLEIHGIRIYLQDSQESTGNWFLQGEIYDSNGEFGIWLTLDEETGKTLSLQFFHTSAMPSAFSVKNLGMALLDHLDVEYDLSFDSDTDLVLSLRKQKLLYRVSMLDDSFQIAPEIDFSTLDAKKTGAASISTDDTNSSVKILP